MIDSTAIVLKESFLTVAPAQMDTDQLADVVIDGLKKFRNYLPYVIELKRRFDSGERDSSNRLKAPIKGCYSWLDFCNNRLDRTPQSVGDLLIEAKGVASVCPECGESFPSKSKLRKHAYRNHPETRAPRSNPRPVAPVQTQEPVEPAEPPALPESPIPVSTSTINAAQELKDDYPELYDQVVHGKITLAQARLKIRPAPDEMFKNVEDFFGEYDDPNDPSAGRSAGRQWLPKNNLTGVAALNAFLDEHPEYETNRRMAGNAIALYEDWKKSTGGGQNGGRNGLHRRSIFHLGDIHRQKGPAPQDLPELPAAPTQAQHSYEEWLEIISRRILARDGADEDYTKEPTEPLGWKTRNTVRVRITTFIHNLDDRYTFWHELSALLWAAGWAGNTVFREGRREAWIFHWTDPKTQPDRSPELPEDMSPTTDMAPNDGPVEPDEPEPSQLVEPAETPLENVQISAQNPPADYALTFHAIRHKASGFFVQTGPSFFDGDEDGTRLPSQSLQLAYRLFDDSDNDSSLQQKLFKSVVKALGKQTRNRKLHLKPEDFEIVEVRASYSVTPIAAPEPPQPEPTKPKKSSKRKPPQPTSEPSQPIIEPQVLYDAVAAPSWFVSAEGILRPMESKTEKAFAGLNWQRELQNRGLDEREARRIAARSFNVAPKYIRAAQRIEKVAPELADECRVKNTIDTVIWVLDHPAPTTSVRSVIHHAYED